jgi:hypothetical protein
MREINPTDLEQLVRRLRAEYTDWSTLKLTLPQVRRLCGADDARCRAALDLLVRSDFLSLTADGCFVRAPVARRRGADGAGTPGPRRGG